MEDKQEPKLETKYYKLEKLVKWDKCNEVNEMLMNNVSPHKVSDWCKENGFSISHPKLYEYRDMLQEAIANHITVERLLGIGAPKRTPIQLQALGVKSSKDMVKNEMELLDAVIQRGFNVLLNTPGGSVQDAMKAIEMKNKLTGGKHGGLTAHGLDQLRELEQAKFNSIVSVVLEYLPEDKHEELETAIAEAERKFYEERAPEFLEDYEESVQEDIDSATDTSDGVAVSDKPY